MIWPLRGTTRRRWRTRRPTPPPGRAGPAVDLLEAAHPLGEVGQGAELAALIAVRAEHLDRLGAHVLDRGQAEADPPRPLDREVGPREVDVGRQDLDPARLAVDDGRRHV